MLNHVVPVPVFNERTLEKMKKMERRRKRGLVVYYCKKCNFATPDKFSLVKHSRTHSGERPFECGICDDKFRQKGNLIQHLLTHHVRDLGVTHSYDYSWSAHIAKTAEDSKKMLHWVLSVFRDRSKLTMLTLYKSMVRSKLVYCCPLWDPSAISDIRKLEDVQGLFTSRVPDCQGMSYWERLKALNLQSLQRRRERYVIIHTWKILNDLANNDIGISFTDTENETRSGVTATVPSIPQGVSAKVISIY